MLRRIIMARWSVRLKLSLVVIIATITSFIYMISRATKSENTEMYDMLKGLLPSGNCNCQSSTNFECGLCLDCASGGAWNSGHSNTASQDHGNWTFTFGRDDKNEGLDEAQCAASFPGLFEDIRRAVDLRRNNPVTLAELDAIKIHNGNSLGIVRAKIHDGELFVLASKFYDGDDDDDHRRKGLAILQSISRAMSTTLDRRALPNIEFVFSVEDFVSDATQPIWALARRAQDQKVWLIPDFAFWSWRVKGTGPLSSVVAEIVDREASASQVEQKQMLFWRGRISASPKLRRGLIDAARNKPWSAVRALQNPTNAHTPSESGNFMSAADQCNYMFIAHAEGRSYSGSLKYRQVCRSVVVSHKLQWIQHHHYLLVANGTQQNFVEVERDFSDLEQRMEWLLSHPKEARRIADNSVRTFRERYLTPAAEACYWRALIRGWGSVSFKGKLYEPHKEDGRRQRGVRFESYALFKSSKQIAWSYHGR